MFNLLLKGVGFSVGSSKIPETDSEDGVVPFCLWCKTPTCQFAYHSISPVLECACAEREREREGESMVALVSLPWDMVALVGVISVELYPI